MHQAMTLLKVSNTYSSNGYLWEAASRFTSLTGLERTDYFSKRYLIIHHSHPTERGFRFSSIRLFMVIFHKRKPDLSHFLFPSVGFPDKTSRRMQKPRTPL